MAEGHGEGHAGADGHNRLVPALRGAETPMCRAEPCHAEPLHAEPCHAEPSCATACCATLCHAVPCHAEPCRAEQCHAEPCHAVSCHAELCHAVPHHGRRKQGDAWHQVGARDETPPPPTQPPGQPFSACPGRAPLPTRSLRQGGDPLVPSAGGFGRAEASADPPGSPPVLGWHLLARGSGDQATGGHRGWAGTLPGRGISPAMDTDSLGRGAALPAWGSGGVDRHSMAQNGPAWHGLAWPGSAWHGPARHDAAHRSAHSTAWHRVA